MGAMLSAKQDALKSVSELYGIPVALVFHAVEHGAYNAHNRFKAPSAKKLEMPKNEDPDAESIPLEPVTATEW